MKNSKLIITILFILALSSTSLFASSGYIVSYSQPLSDQINLDFDLEDYGIGQTIKNGVTYSTINFENSVTTKKNGFAELPFIHAAVQLSNTKNVSLEIIANDYVEYQLDHPLLPSRGTIYRNQDPSSIPYEISEASITDEFYPGNIVETMEPFIIRDVRGSLVYVYPFQYNAQSNILRVYENVTVKLTDNGSIPINPINNEPQRITRAMNSLYKTVFVNYSETRFDNELDEFGSILVIHTPRDADAIAPYIEWKREKGITVYVEEVSTGTNVTSLVSSQYSSHNDILYVQLVGDWADISGTTIGGTATDPTLGCVVGGDVYPDLIVGRFSASYADQVTTQVEKTITYEKTPEIGGDWYSKGLGIGSSEGSGIGDDGEADYTHIDIIKDDKLLPFTYTEVAEAYGNPSMALVSGPVNDGLTIINYCGHGSTTSWVTSGFNNTSVNNLSNGDKLPFIISVACVNGAFQSAECFAEAWLHKSGGGAVGMLASTINMSWDPPMRGQDYINDLLIGGYDYSAHAGQNGINTDVQKTTFGAVCLNGSILMVTEDYSGGLNEMQHWTIFGDASLQVRTDTPEILSLSNSAVLMGVDFSTNITAGGMPAENATVTLSQDGEAFSGVANSNGDVTIVHGLEAGICTMVVTGFNTETIYDDAVAVIPPGGPYVLLNSFETFDNNNNIPEFNETITLDIELENVGTDDATGIDITLSTTNSYITITDADETLALIEDGEIVSLTDAFVMEVANNIPDQSIVTFTLEMVGNEGTWDSQFNIVFNAPLFEAGIMEIVDSGGDGVLDPGETATISIPIINSGNATSEDIVAELTSSSPNLITVTNGTYNADGLDAAEQTIATFDIEVDDNATMGMIANLGLMINSGGYSSAFPYYPSIGLIMENFETGDFSLFDWQMGSFGFEIDNTNAYEGTYCATSSTINHSQSASISVTMDVPTDGEISFYKRVSSESNWDYLKFYINNVEQDEWSGTVAWSQETYPVTAGTDIEFKWAYEKDGSVSSGSDCGWIDEIVFPAAGGGDAPIISLSTEEIEFGNVNLNETATEQLTIFNMGTVELNGSITAPDGFSSELTSYTVEAGGNIVIDLEFTPTEAITYSGNLVITSNDPNQAEVMVALSGTGVGTGSGIDLLPTVTELNGNYPNPFNPTTKIKFSLKADSKVLLNIYNVRGQKVKTLINDRMQAGYHSIVWDGRDDSGKSVSSGVYFNNFGSADESGDYTSVKKMILLK